MMFQHGGPKQRKRRSCVIWLGLTIFTLYITLTVYAAYNLIKTTEIHKAGGKELRENADKPKQSPDQYGEIERLPSALSDVEVWGKAAIGLYFWEHIMEGTLEKMNDELWSYGVKIVDNVRFKFRTGPGIVPHTVPLTSQYVVLIINGRIIKKIEFAKMWLNSLNSLQHLKRVAVILLGNEQCNNDWLLPYTEQNGGLVNMVHIVYDIPNQDDRTLQWPLGVATYRNFPRINLSGNEISESRAYMCNFLGTVYRGSSRETLRDIFNKHKLYSICYLRIREKWQPNESKETAEEYYQVLLQSDLTLCPVGINTECYRIYEACSYGSVPVVEDVQTKGNCSSTPLQLLKFYNAPFIYVKSWNELPDILEKEKQLSPEEKARRRKMLLEWYQEFKKKLRQSFVTKLKQTFFSYSNK